MPPREWLAACNTGEATRIISSGGKLRCGRYEGSIPPYTHIPTYIRGLREKRRRLARECYDMQHSIMNGTSVGRREYDTKVAEIREVDEKIDELMAARHNAVYFEERDAIKERIDAAKAREAAHVTKRSAHDPRAAKEVARSFRDRLAATKDLEGLSGSPINEFIKSEFADIPLDPLAKTPIDPPAKKPARRKEKPQPLTKVQKEEIKENIKDLLKKVFRFKSKEECTSKQRSKEYYMNKEDILKEIEANENLKKLMPTNYKGLTKEKLCEYFFDRDSSD